MGEANGGRARGPRCLAIVGPFAGGKTTLLEAILARTGAIQRQGSVAAGNTVGDASPEARAQRMSVSLNIATADFMGDSYTFLDCPGSVEFLHDMRLALAAAFVYREHASSEVVEIPDEERAREVEARYSMLEKLADYDDKLMEQLLDDLSPPRDLVFDDLSRDLREGLIVPVLIGSAEHGNGILRLLKALRHEAPGIETTRGRLGIEPNGQSVVHVLKTIHAGHGGKLSVARVLAGAVQDGTVLTRPDGGETRVSGLFRMLGEQTQKLDKAGAGDTVAIGRLEGVQTGETLTTGRGAALPLDVPAPPA